MRQRWQCYGQAAEERDGRHLSRPAEGHFTCFARAERKVTTDLRCLRESLIVRDRLESSRRDRGRRVYTFRCRILPTTMSCSSDTSSMGRSGPTNAGHVVDPKHRYLPLLIAQIGVATTELCTGRLRVKNYDCANILFFPDSFAAEDVQSAGTAVREAGLQSGLPLSLEVERYEVDDTDDRLPIDRARARVLHRMHSMEIDRIVSLAKEGDVTRDALLLIDGSIEFYADLERHKEAFRNVVGVAKSFNLYHKYGKSERAEQVGEMISRLPSGQRTPARGTKHRNLTIASWYLRLHGRNRMPSLEYADGVVKVEVFPDNPTDESPSIDAARCDRISEHVFALRAPATPGHGHAMGEPFVSDSPDRALHQDAVPERQQHQGMSIIVITIHTASSEVLW